MSTITKHWKLISACLLLAGLIYFMVFHWDRFLLDFWPIDHSNVGPNLVASVVQYGIITITLVLLYPPFRRAAEKFAVRHVESIKTHVSTELAVQHDELHEHLHHISEKLGIEKFERPAKP